jgi:hypothetical protein
MHADSFAHFAGDPAGLVPSDSSSHGRSGRFEVKSSRLIREALDIDDMDDARGYADFLPLIDALAGL